jgi:hypothetical protein
MLRSYRSTLLALLILVGGLAAPALHTSAAAPAPVEMQSMPGMQVITYYAGPVEHPVKVPPPDAFLQRAQGVGAQTATITVNYNGTWDANAQNAFQYAADIWETLVTSPVAITVDAYWKALLPGQLGGAGSNNFAANFPGALMTDTWYPIAIANKLAGTDLDPDYDIHAEFNSNFSDWYFGTDGNPGSQVDFVSVVLHELGHGLGFSGSMRVGGATCGTGNGCWGSGTSYPFIYDRYAVNGSGQLLISSFANYSTVLASQLTSGNIYFNGANAVKANSNANVKLYAPGTWAQGSSYSHLDEIFNGTPNALMTYSIGSGESIHNPGPVMLCMFKDVGWTVTVSGSSAASASVASAPGFAAFGPDNVTATVLTPTLYLPLIMNSYSTAPC